MDVQRITYDEERDLLEVYWVPTGPVVETRYGKSGVTVDYDADGNLAIIHVPNATALFGQYRDPASMVMTRDVV